MNKIILTSMLLLTACSPAVAQEPVIQDHFKEVINQKPYHVEVCSNYTTNGDKSGDMLKGAIIGGIIGNNVGNIENGGALGAVLGGMLGHSNSDAQPGTQRKCRTEIRYNEERQTIYSHSTIRFMTNGKYYTLKFRK
tara:strand:+ start:121 stop:531 length:411 start_codon:yes stop_codon:yes gene_type:complete